jgi:lipid II:glycine glycyltransferase (peptidoglycan interpeptide bridge formation enzyme)
MAGQAIRRGVTCQKEAGPDAVDCYYDLLVDTAARWGLSQPHIPKTLFQALSHYCGDDVEFWFAKYSGEAIAGVVALYGSEEVNVWSAAMRDDMAVLRPQNLLNVTLIRAAAERGVRWYNLGSSEGLPGVKRFKEGLGARIVLYRTYVYQRPIYRLYSRVRSVLTGTR